MQQKMKSHNSHYFNNWLLLAKLLSLLIFAYSLTFFVSCRRNGIQHVPTAQNQPEIAKSAININTANHEDFEKLPRIGTELARRIIEHREKYGAFRRPENLILVRE